MNNNEIKTFYDYDGFIIVSGGCLMSLKTKQSNANKLRDSNRFLHKFIVNKAININSESLANRSVGGKIRDDKRQDKLKNINHEVFQERIINI